ncbi:hypothetical protein TNCV_4496941 [Trichonephila clavipes]|nr:hypothetical protein TNCV_4496941 [Trichonephila clavipes]
MVAIVTKPAANLVTKYDANLALSPRSRQVPNDVTSCYPFPSLFTKSPRQISSNREERCYTSKRKEHRYTWKSQISNLFMKDKRHYHFKEDSLN